MLEKLRWGILSTARINEAVIYAIRSARRSSLAAVASREVGRAREYAAENNIQTAYGSYEDLLADPNIDVIYVPLPNTLHAEWTVKAAQAGKHVLVEKPIVTKIEELNAIETAARENKVTIFEAFMSLHAPQNRQVLAMISEGRIGQVRLINSWFSYYLPPEDRQNIRLDPQLDGGSFWDVGVYPNSLAISLTGGRAPLRVWAIQDMGESGVDVSMAAQLHFAGGAAAQIYSGFRSPFVQGAQIIGSEGMIRLDKSWIPGMEGRSQPGSDTTIELTSNSGSSEKIVVKAANPWQKEVEAMEACVIDGAPPVVPLSISREFLKSALAVHESARTGQIVEL